MYPYIHFILPSYIVMTLVGGFFSLCFIYFRLERYNIEFTTFLVMSFFCVIGGFAGSKILFAITQIPWLIENFSIRNLLLLIPQSGLVFYGGLFGVIFTLLLMTRKDLEFKLNIFRLCVPAMPLFHAFGRVGCFLTGCCYGKDLVNTVTIGTIELTQIPVQIIEAVAEMVLFVIIVIIEKNHKKVDLLAIYLILYAIIRFADEFLRGDTIRGIFFGLSTAQWISLIILLYYIVKFILKRYKRA